MSGASVVGAGVSNFSGCVPLFLLLLSTLIGGGCASYTPAELRSLTADKTASVAVRVRASGPLKDADVKVYAAALSSPQVRAYFDRDIGGKGYRVVQFTIVNNSDRPLLLDNGDIGLPTADAAAVAALVKTSTAGRAGGYGLFALAFPLLVVPAVVDGVKSMEANAQLEADFAARCADVCIIPPRSMRNHVIFVRIASFQKMFELSLVDGDDAGSTIDYKIVL
jgi:hypothetical protein